MRRADRAAASFAANDFVHRHAFAALMERMEPMQIKCSRILDLGCASGVGSRQLAQHFRRCQIVSLDLSQNMLAMAKQQRPRRSKITELRADAMRLPLVSGSMDIVFVNLLLPWISDPGQLFREISRVLRVDGLLVYSTLGPASLGNVRQAWGNSDGGRDAHVNPFMDMHNVADAVVQAGLRDPVVDVEPLTISYRDITSLFRDLTAVGARNCLRSRCSSLTGKNRFRHMQQGLLDQFQEGVLRLELELIYGHAWGGGPVPPHGEFHLDPAQIGRRQR